MPTSGKQAFVWRKVIRLTHSRKTLERIALEANFLALSPCMALLHHSTSKLLCALLSSGISYGERKEKNEIYKT